MRFKAKMCGLIVALGLALGLATIPTPAYAAPIPCDVNALKAAIIAANTAGSGTIQLAPNCTYSLTTVDNTLADGPNGLPRITGDVTITGANSTIERAATATPFRIFEVEGPSGKLTLITVNVRNGDADGFDGGAVLVDNNTTLTVLNHTVISGNNASVGGGIAVHTGGNLKVANSTVSDNTADSGGGIGLFSGVNSIDNSAITNNRAHDNGGGVTNDGTLSINNTSITGNSTVSPIGGGGVENTGTLNVNASRFLENSAINGAGGGLLNFNTTGQATVNSSSFQRNRAVSGGGLATLSGAATTLNSSVVVANTALATAGGIFNLAATTTLTSSVVAANQPNNCIGSAPPVSGCVG